MRSFPFGLTRAPGRRAVLLGGAALAAAGLGGALWRGAGRSGAAPEKARAFYASPLAPPEEPLRVYHLGHSLVGRDMPAMLAQLVGGEYDYSKQTGWGTSLKEHWEPDLPINGYEASNDHPRHRPAKEALASGMFNAVVLTEMVEIRDARRYHGSADYLARWTELARRGNPDCRVYLYETWHHTDDPEGWLARIDGDLDRHWLGGLAHPVLARDLPIHLIPGGQVMAAATRAIEEGEGLPGLRSRDDLLARRADGTPDTIHLNDAGAYLMALTHYAVLTHRSPVGLPHRLRRADGSPAATPSAEAVRALQQIVARVVLHHPETGVAAWA